MANPIISEDYADFIIENVAADIFPEGTDITYMNILNSIAHVPVSDIDMCTIGKYPYAVVPALLTLESEINLDVTGVSQIRNNPNFAFYGQGVLVGVIDTGIEYQHQAFMNRDGTTRIVSIWDQTINNGETPPEGFTFGTEYTREKINNALMTGEYDSVPTRDDIGHGTMIAGALAGSENRNEEFSGVVPESEIIVVKLKQAKKIIKQISAVPEAAVCYQETDAILGVRYVVEIANRLQRPLSICFAMGTSQSGHYGVGSLSGYIDYLTQISRICASVSAGNQANKRRHYLGEIEGEGDVQNFELRVAENEQSFAMEIWQASPNLLSIEITTPTGEFVPAISPKLGDCRRFGFIFEQSVIWVNNFISESETGDQLVLIRFETPQSGVWKFGVRNIINTAATFHVWLPTGELISDDTYFLNSTPDMTVTSPGNGNAQITTGAFNPVDGAVALFSGRGYSMLGVVKPDLLAPGVNITCPTINNSYGSTSGTGVAAAQMAGIAAMVLEWAVERGNFTNISGFDIKQLLIRGARRETWTVYPNNISGYGKVDIYGLFEQLR